MKKIDQKIAELLGEIRALCESNELVDDPIYGLAEPERGRR
jgi:hypothetical protein